MSKYTKNEIFTATLVQLLHLTAKAIIEENEEELLEIAALSANIIQLNYGKTSKGYVSVFTDKELEKETRDFIEENMKFIENLDTKNNCKCPRCVHAAINHHDKSLH